MLFNQHSSKEDYVKCASLINTRAIYRNITIRYVYNNKVIITPPKRRELNISIWFVLDARLQDKRTSNMAAKKYETLSEIHPSRTPLSTSPSCFPSWSVKLYLALITCTPLPPSFISPDSLSLSLSAGETLLWAKFSTGVIQYLSLHFPRLSPTISVPFNSSSYSSVSPMSLSVSPPSCPSRTFGEEV